MNSISSLLGPPPLQTPITAAGSDQSGIPFQSRGLASGNLHVAWGAWFNALVQRVLGSPRMLSGVQASLAGIAATLTNSDVGLLVSVTDYGHLLQWTGSAWQWAPGEIGSGMMAVFEVDPTGTGWHLYDGSTVNYLKADGTLGSVTLPNLAGTAAYVKAGSPNSGPNVAIAPTATATSLAPASGSVLAGTGASTSFLTSITNPHTHTISTTGEPVNLVRRPYFRQ